MLILLNGDKLWNDVSAKLFLIKERGAFLCVFSPCLRRFRPCVVVSATKNKFQRSQF